MKKYIAIIVFSTCSFFFQESAVAGNQCFSDLEIIDIGQGFLTDTFSFTYTDSDQVSAMIFSTIERATGHGGMATDLRKTWGVDPLMSFYQGGKGYAMYQTLAMAMALKLKVTGWNNNRDSSDSQSCRQIDTIRISN
ncbi:hypothetical protein [Aeromonas jandaei]|uniref:hypothetical protein n=1 Tax=Aeromonas jandaei TaxID=650 RepID=UPI003EC5174D